MQMEHRSESFSDNANRKARYYCKKKLSLCPRAYIDIEKFPRWSMSEAIGSITNCPTSAVATLPSSAIIESCIR
jgi:hypothetical protein